MYTRKRGKCSPDYSFFCKSAKHSIADRLGLSFFPVCMTPTAPNDAMDGGNAASPKTTNTIP